jgi:NAD(P)-dependent dehydrogenase (short-subunit alcohol dehydrogenase family)
MIGIAPFLLSVPVAYDGKGLRGNSTNLTLTAIFHSYGTSKLLNIFYLRELQKHMKPSPVIINCVNPGICAGRHSKHWFKKKIVRTADEGGRILVLAILAGKESQGQYIDNCKVAQ